MSNFSNIQEKKKEVREKDKVRREKLASFFYDAAKLTLGGIVIGGISPVFASTENEMNLRMILAGAIATFAFAKIGNDILK